MIKLKLRHVIESTDNMKRLGRTCPEVTSDFLLPELNDFFFFVILLVCPSVCDTVGDQQASSYLLKFSPLLASTMLS